MSAIGVVLLLVGGSGITGIDGNMQPICIAMVAVGAVMLLLGQKVRGRE